MYPGTFLELVGSIYHNSRNAFNLAISLGNKAPECQVAISEVIIVADGVSILLRVDALYRANRIELSLPILNSLNE